MKYKVGQTVKIVECEYGDHTGKEGRILKVDDKFYHVDYLGDGILAGTCSALEVELVNPTPSRYTGELKVGMRVWVVDAYPKYSDYTGERTVCKENNQWVLKVGSNNRQEYEQKGNGEWWSPAGFFYISHVISEPEEKDEPNKKVAGNEDDLWPESDISRGWSVDQQLRDSLYFQSNYRIGVHARGLSPINNSPRKGVLNTIMDSIKTIPNKVKRFLNDSYKRFYKLGWIDEGLNLTSEGSNALEEFLLSKFEKEFGEYAGKELKALKKQLKSGKGKKDETDDDE